MADNTRCAAVSLMCRFVRIHPAPPAGNLLRRPASIEVHHHAVPQRRPRRQLPPLARAAQLIATRRRHRVIAYGGLIAGDCSRYRRGRTIQLPGHGMQARALQPSAINRVPLVHRQMLVMGSHRHTVLKVRCCTSFWSPPSVCVGCLYSKLEAWEYSVDIIE